MKNEKENTNKYKKLEELYKLVEKQVLQIEFLLTEAERKIIQSKQSQVFPIEKAPSLNFEKLKKNLQILKEIFEQCSSGEKIDVFIKKQTELEHEINIIKSILQENGINLEERNILQKLEHIKDEWKNLQYKIEELKKVSEEIQQKLEKGIINEINLYPINERMAEIAYEILKKQAYDKNEIDMNLLEYCNIDRNLFVKQMENEYNKKFPKPTVIPEEAIENQELWNMLLGKGVTIKHEIIPTEKSVEEEKNELKEVEEQETELIEQSSIIRGNIFRHLLIKIQNLLIGKKAKYICKYGYIDEQTGEIKIIYTKKSKFPYKKCGRYDLLELEISAIPDFHIENGMDFSELRKVTFGPGILYIGDFSFSFAINLKEIVFGETVMKIGNYAFQSCSNLKSLEMGKITEHIGESAFQGCNDLEEVKLNNNLRYIGEKAFEATSLMQIYIPENTEFTSISFNLPLNDKIQEMIQEGKVTADSNKTLKGPLYVSGNKELYRKFFGIFCRIKNGKEPTKVIPTLKTITKENNPETNTNTNESDDYSL